jgi:hypothetical protein
MDTVSEALIPDTWPDPYLISTVELNVLNDVDVEVSKRGRSEGQLGQVLPGSHKSEDPVSRMTVNCWAL